jgi:hypothetical protein
MSLPRTKLLRCAVAVVAGGALVLGSATGADASSQAASFQAASSFHGRAPVIPVDVTTDGGFSLPSHVRSGFVTFKVSSPEDGYHGFQGFRTKNGATLADVMNDFTLGLLGDQAQNAEGARLLLQHATLIGGVVTSSFAPISVTVPMEPGTYFFVDLNDLFNGVTPRVHTLQAVGHPQWTGLPRFSDVIVTTMIDDQPRFVAPTDMSATGTFLVVNTADEIHEAVWRQVIPGTTDAYIQHYYEEFLAGHPLPPRPWLGIQHGLQAFSPDQFAVIHIDLPVGSYALICLVPDDENGLPHAYIGMHQVVDLH